MKTNKTLYELPVIAPWVSCRSYENGNENKTIIFNNLNSEIMVLDEIPSIIWERISKGEAVTSISNDICSNDIDVTDIYQFIDELSELNLFTNTNTNIETLDKPPVMDGQLNKDEAIAIESEFGDWLDSNGSMSSAFLETTYRCNEKCLHCFNPGAAHKKGEIPKRNTSELSFSEYKSIIDELYDLGTYAILISGGEYFLRKDAFDILEYLQLKRIRTTIFTNGTNLSDEKLKRICATYPHQVHISIYSSSPSKHDAFTQVKGSWSQSITTANYLIKNNIKVVLKSPLMEDTSDDYDELISLSKMMGCAISFETSISAGNDGAKLPLDLNVTDFNTIVNLSVEENSPWFVGSKDKIKKRDIDYESSRPCGIGTSSITINPEGNIYPCVALAKKLGDARMSGEITRVWKSDQDSSQDTSISYWQNFDYKTTIECGTHSRCDFCARCIGASFSEHGDAAKASYNQCLHASARERAADLINQGMTKGEIKLLHPLQTNAS